MIGRKPLIIIAGRDCFVFFLSLMLILTLSSCVFNKEKTRKNFLDHENSPLLYCEKELELLHEGLSKEILILNIDSIQTLRDLSNIIKTYYDVDCSYSEVKKVGFTFTHTTDLLELGGIDCNKYIVFRFRNICMSEPMQSEPLRSVCNYMLTVDSKGCFVDIADALKSEKKILETTFDTYFNEANFNPDSKKVCSVFTIEDLSITLLKSILNKLINAYLVNINKFSKKRYLKMVCDLSSVEYRELELHNKLNIEFDMCSGAKRGSASNVLSLKKH